jgi:predicted amidohydrolase YtcJ
MCNACDARFLQVMRSYSDRSGRRDFMRGLGAIAATAAAGSPLEVLAKAESATAADQIFISKTIHTMNSKNAVVEAVAVRQGKIMALGSRKDLIGLSGRNTQVIDLGERVVLPGFVEPHMHSNFCSLRPWLDVGPFTTANMEEALGKIQQTAATTALPWVQGKMLDPSIMPGAPMTRQALDKVSPNRPVFVLESNGHVAYVNSRAIELAGVTKAMPDPPQGRFVRSADGELTGRLEEPSAFQPFVSAMPTPSPEELIKFLRADLDEASAKGCTTLHDAGIGGLFAEGDLALLDAVMAGNPGVRYAGLLVSTHFAKWQEMKLRPGVRSKRFTLNGIKAWADGSNQGLTGFQRSPYLGSSNRGALNYTTQEIEAVIRQAHEAGWQIGVHANGDAAIDTVLDGFERVAGPGGGRKLRHRIEHCSILDKGQIARMAKLGVSPSFLIGHVHYWGRAFQERLLGPQRADRLDPCRSALAGGLKISLHSDYNVTPIDPLRCIENAVVRDMREGGGVLNANECITPLQAIRAMTIDAAWQCHLDHLCGSLEVGKVADFVVLERDPTQVAPKEISKIAIHSTWLDGERRFSA